jgi:hypothetical protein
MTIAQDRYFYVDINADGSETYKGILEFRDSDDNEAACVFRIHPASKIVLLSELVGFDYSLLEERATIATLIWQRYLEVTKINASDISWMIHEGMFSGRYGRVDIRYPYRDINPSTGKNTSRYSNLLVIWNGSSFKCSESEKSKTKTITDSKEIQFIQSHLGTVEEITKKFNWQRNIDRLDIEYYRVKDNKDHSKTIKAIHHWDHPDYPSHCLLRIYLDADRAMVIMSEIQSNTPPHRSIYSSNHPTNGVKECLVQVVNSVHLKYRQELAQYDVQDMLHIYEWGEFTSPSDYRDIPVIPSRMKAITLSQNGLEFNYTYPAKEQDNYIEVKDPDLRILRSDKIGTAEESLLELGWRNY